MFAQRHAVLVEEPAQIVQDLVGGLAGQPVDLVEDHEGDLRVSGEGPQIALVQGGVGVLLRVHHPDHRVDERQHPVHLVAVSSRSRVVVGQVDQDEALERLVCRRAAGLGPAPEPSGDREPVQQPRGAVRPRAGEG